MLYALSFAFFNCLDSFVGVFLVITIRLSSRITMSTDISSLMPFWKPFDVSYIEDA